jgi:hypothetical protein
MSAPAVSLKASSLVSEAATLMVEVSASGDVAAVSSVAAGVLLRGSYAAAPTQAGCCLMSP